jgi:hypothetical protein
MRNITNRTQSIRRRVLDGSIPSAIADSGATSHVGTTKDSSKHAFIPTGKPSTKVFQLPDGKRTPASDIQQLHHNVRQLAKDVHIVTTIASNSLLSTAKFTAAGYITVFDGKEVNIYDANNTKVSVTREALLQGWFDKTANLWRVPLLPIVLNETTDTVLVSKTPTEYLPDRPPPIDAVHNVYELKTQPELICYLHAAAGFPTKPTWLAVKKTSTTHRGRDSPPRPSPSTTLKAKKR